MVEAAEEAVSTNCCRRIAMMRTPTTPVTNSRPNRTAVISDGHRKHRRPAHHLRAVDGLVVVVVVGKTLMMNAGRNESADAVVVGRKEPPPPLPPLDTVFRDWPLRPDGGHGDVTDRRNGRCSVAAVVNDAEPNGCCSVVAVVAVVAASNFRR